MPTVEERNFECVSTASVLNDNEDSVIDELLGSYQQEPRYNMIQSGLMMMVRPILVGTEL